MPNFSESPPIAASCWASARWLAPAANLSRAWRPALPPMIWPRPARKRGGPILGACRSPGPAGRLHRWLRKARLEAGRLHRRRGPDCAPDAPASQAARLRRRRQGRRSRLLRSGATARETCPGPITASHALGSAIRFCQRPRAARRSASVIVPWSATTMIAKGASKPGAPAPWISSASWRASLSSGQLADVEGPGLQASAGAARTKTRRPIATVTGAGRRSAAPTRVIRRELPSPGARPSCQRSTLVPSKTRIGGPRRFATRTVSATDYGQRRGQRSEQRTRGDDEGDGHREDQACCRRKTPFALQCGASSRRHRLVEAPFASSSRKRETSSSA